MSGISEERLAQLEKEFLEYDAHNLVELIDEVRRLRAENKELKKKVALLTSDKRDLIEEIDGPVSESW